MGPTRSGPADAFETLAARGTAVLRVCLLPIALVGLPTSRYDPALDVFPYVLGAFAVFAFAMLLAAFRPGIPTPSPLVLALADLILVALVVYASGGVRSPLRFAFYAMPIIAALRLSLRLTAGWTGLALGAYLAVTIPHANERLPGDTDLIFDEALSLAWVGAAAMMLSALLGQRDRRLAELAASRRQLVQEALQSEARERRRLAQALHDESLQNVLLARQEVTDVERSVPGAADRLRQALDATQRQLRSEAFSMHPVGLESAGVASVLQHLADEAGRRGGFEASVHVSPTAEHVRSDLVLAAARELLGNVAKHAGASHVTVALEASANTLELRVGDDGVGIGHGQLARALKDGHIGVAALKERLDAVGGRLDLESSADGGTVFTAILPPD